MYKPVESLKPAVRAVHADGFGDVCDFSAVYVADAEHLALIGRSCICGDSNIPIGARTTWCLHIGIQ